MTRKTSTAPRDATPSAFDIPVFRAVWLASMFSNFGGLIQSVGASWMMVSLTHSPTLVALVQASTTLPIMLLSLLAGAIADNRDRRTVMLCAQGFMLVVSATLSVFAYCGWLSPWLLLGFTFLIGVGTAFNGPAWQASVGDMVPRAALPGAVALNSMGFNIARSLGPAIGGAILAVAGAAATFAVNSVSYIGLLAVLARWRPQLPQRLLPPERIGVAMEAGIRYVAMSPHIRTVLLRAALFGLAASAVPALMPLVARNLGGPFTYGVLLGAFGTGAVGGALLAPRLRQRVTVETIVRGATFAMAAGALITGISGNLAITIPALFAAGTGWVLVLSTLNVTVQLASPRWVVGRALALYQMAAFGGMALGSWIFGEAASLHGVGLALVAAGVVQAAGILLGVRMPLAGAGGQNVDPLGSWREPDVAVPIEPRSGPIVVTIEYRIPAGKIPAFLAAMAERRRIRIRDGARHWVLMRDLGEADLWVERYHVATWLDYVRHNQRRTHADAENSARIIELHSGVEPPKVHRMIERQTGSLPVPLPKDVQEPLTDPTRSS